MSLLLPIVPALLALVADAGTADVDARVPLHERADRDEPPPARWTFAPEGFLYPIYVADPRRATFGLVAEDLSRNGIPDTTDARYDIRMGGRFGITRRARGERRVGAWQLDLSVLFLSKFDRDGSNDGVGWDGLFGLAASTRLTPALALRAGVAHDSAHVADEYVLATGRERLEYTREEVHVGLAWDPDGPWTVYGELGHGFTLRNEDVMEPGRAQVGASFERPAPAGTWTPYAGVDLTAYEEDDWDPSLALQAGWARRGGNGRTWRVGLTAYDGRSVLGEFFRSDERFVGLGVWID